VSTPQHNASSAVRRPVGRPLLSLDAATTVVLQCARTLVNSAPTNQAPAPALRQALQCLDLLPLSPPTIGQPGAAASATDARLSVVLPALQLLSEHVK